MANLATSVAAKGLRRPPQVTLALDEDTHVLYVNRELAGTAFANLTDESDAPLHELVHPDCDGNCRFNTLLRKAWKTLRANRESVEWEIEDPVWAGHLRLNLSRPPTSKNVAVDRRRRFALLTMTDITEIRREFESVLNNNRELQRKIDALERNASASGDPPQDAPPQSVNARILAAQERERRRIAADLHDGVAQTMGVVKFGVESRIADLRSRYPEIDLSELEAIVDQVREAIEDLRKISHDLSPSVLGEFGICTAIDMLCNEFGLDVPNVEVVCASCVNEIDIPEPIKVAIYRIVQEALNNIGKYAQPQNVRVALLADDSNLSVEIKDDGTGFDPALVATSPRSSKGLGLDSMRERAELTGGVFELRSVVGGGTTVRVTWSETTFSLLRDQSVLNGE